MYDLVSKRRDRSHVTCDCLRVSLLCRGRHVGDNEAGEAKRGTQLVGALEIRIKVVKV